MTRPEETLQAVAFPARHDVDVNVRHTLAHAVVDGYESAFRAKCILHHSGEAASVREQLGGDIVR